MINKILQRQQEKTLTLEILLESLVEELIESNLIDEDKLDERLRVKMKIVHDALNKAKENYKEDNEVYPPYFGGPAGQA